MNGGIFGKGISITINEVILTAIGESSFKDSEIKIYPIPSVDKIFIKISTTEKDLYFHLFDLNGQLITTKNIVTDLTELNISRLQKGFYLLKISSNQSTRTFKIIKN